MKICHIISAFQRDDTRIFYKQCTTLAENNHEVILLTNDSVSEETRNNVRIIPTDFKYKNKIQRILLSRKKNLKKALEINANIYQIHDPEFIPIGLKLKKKGKIIIYDSHEDFPRQILEKDWIPKIFRKFLSKAAEYYLKKTLKKYDAILSVTPHIVETLKTISPKVHLLTNYPIIYENDNNFSKNEYIDRNNHLCYAGTVYRSTLQENIIASLENIDNVSYTIVGTFNPIYKIDIKDKLKSEKVNVIDKVSKNELLRIYNTATIGISIFDYSPNLGYKIGSLGVNKIFEYMYAGLPIICTDFELWKEIIYKYQCGIYVKPDSIQEIRDAILFLTFNKDKAYEMGQNGRRAVIDEYNWNIQGKIYLNIINKVSR